MKGLMKKLLKSGNLKPLTFYTKLGGEMKKFFFLLGLGAIVLPVLLFSGSSVTAQIPKLINYQGMLTNNLGDPLEGSYDLTFIIYDDSTAGNLKWSEAQAGVEVNNGLFNVVLGEVTALSLAFGEPYWLELVVESDTFPRMRLTTSIYAFRALVADSAVVAGSGGGAFSTTSNVTSNSPGNLAYDDFVFGSDQLDDIADTDDDYRIFFDKSKGAFRAGRATGAQWDDSLRGSCSFASGQNTTASGNQSTAMGGLTTASGDNSTAMGGLTTASGAASTAMGNQSTASGNFSFAMGYSTTASGDYSSAQGHRTTASGWQSTAMGSQTTARGNVSTAMGFSTTAIGMHSTAMGNETTAQSYLSVVLGHWNVVSGDSMAWVETDPLFVIGDGSSMYSRSNAFEVRKDGVVSGAFGTYHDASDARLKENITQLPDALDKVMQLRGVTFNWKEGDDKSTKYGMIAQEVEEILPQMVHTNEKGYKAIEWWQLNGVYVEAIKRQQEQIETLQQENDALKVQDEAKQNAILALQQQLAELEQKVNDGLLGSK